MDNYTILTNVLSCLVPKDRWIAVDRVIKSPSRVEMDIETGKEVNVTKKHKSTHVNKFPVERVALKLSDIKAEYRVYVERRQKAVVQKLNFNGF